MTPAISPISAQALHLLPVLALPIASASNRGWVMRWRGDGQVYENKSGTAWTRLADGASAPPTAIDNDTQFTGNPTDLDTPAEFASAIQTLQAWKTLVDADADGEVDAIEEVNMPLIVATAGQTVFTLPRAPRYLLSAVVFAGGVSLNPSLQTFTITGTTLVWHHPAQLVPSDTLFISYR